MGYSTQMQIVSLHKAQLAVLTKPCTTVNMMELSGKGTATEPVLTFHQCKFTTTNDDMQERSCTSIILGNGWQVSRNIDGYGDARNGKVFVKHLRRNFILPLRLFTYLNYSICCTALFVKSA